MATQLRQAFSLRRGMGIETAPRHVKQGVQHSLAGRPSVDGLLMLGMQLPEKVQR
jgi:hypothetical protein